MDWKYDILELQTNLNVMCMQLDNFNYLVYKVEA